MREAKDATTRTAHGLDEAFLTNKTNHFEFAIFIEFFDLLKLTGRHVNGIVGFFDTGWKKLLLEYRQGIGFQAAKLHLIKRMVLRKERPFECAQNSPCDNC